MKAMVWNCQGVGNPLTVSQLRRLISLHSPFIFCLLETKNSNQKLQNINNQIGNFNLHLAPPQGLSGGLALFFPPDQGVTIVDSNAFQITCCIDSGNKLGPWYLTSIYASCDDATRASQWTYLKNLQNRIGPPFTWCNNRGFGHTIRARLDRGLCTLDWLNLFHHSRLYNVPVFGSDHNALLLTLNESISPVKRQFHFDAIWVKNKDFTSLIQSIWNFPSSGSILFQCQEKLKSYKFKLKSWNRSKNYNSRDTIQLLQDQLHLVKSQPTLDRAAIFKLETELGHAWREEELFWKQKSRIAWLNHGDQNTSYFHRKTLIRRQKNFIPGIEDSQGQWLDSKEDVRRVAENFFFSLYLSQGPHQDTAFWNLITPKVTSDMNQSLLREGTEDELKAALFNMGPFKSPGPDGFTPLFFQANWITVKSGKTGFFALKLDIAKVFDRIEWAFLELMLQHMGFDEHWVSLIMECVSTVSYSIIINGESGGLVKPSRGLRQGDPLSPYLFLLCTEGLSTLLHRAHHQNLISGLKLSRYNSPITHLLFADDSLLFRESSTTEARNLRNLLKRYELLSGQLVNFHKFGVFFSTNTRPSRRRKILRILRYKIPFKTCDTLQQKMMRFWWSGSEDLTHSHWIKWDSLCQQKKDGGLGFKDLRSFNMALLSKLTLRLFKGDTSLLFQSLKAKYFHNCSFLDSHCKTTASWIWRGIHACIPIILKGTKWSISDGSLIKYWEDPWLPDPNNHFISTPVPPHCSIFIVTDLTLPYPTRWNIPLIKNTFNIRDSNLILGIPLRETGGVNSPIWGASPSGRFTVKSAYHIAMLLNFPKPGPLPSIGSSNAHIHSPNWAEIWKLKTSRKIQFFIRQCAHNRLPVLHSLKARRIASCSICPVCGIEEESLIHLLFRCHISLTAWRISPLRLDFASIPCISWPQIWKILSSLWHPHPDGDSFKSFFTFLCWQLWLTRNNWHFNRKRGNPKSIVDCALFSFNEFWEAKSQNGRMTFPHFSSPPHPSHWLPPTLGRLKLNVMPLFRIILTAWEVVSFSAIILVLLSVLQPFFLKALSLLKLPKLDRSSMVSSSCTLGLL
ncbi:uncharacterized protein LOC132313890 [Cornus florida]|uniref:uncharacterized protein LOC132313890 n=1 Tax=Cornus florida TaxID=4283 RepID=UPI0028A25B10|nr:uncharacterized protein LOC132313890 [Cornus florida]